MRLAIVFALVVPTAALRKSDMDHVKVYFRDEYTQATEPCTTCGRCADIEIVALREALMPHCLLQADAKDHQATAFVSTPSLDAFQTIGAWEEECVSSISRFQRFPDDFHRLCTIHAGKNFTKFEWQLSRSWRQQHRCLSNVLQDSRKPHNTHAQSKDSSDTCALLLYFNLTVYLRGQPCNGCNNHLHRFLLHKPVAHSTFCEHLVPATKPLDRTLPSVWELYERTRFCMRAL
jgi:hypothetical protein